MRRGVGVSEAAAVSFESGVFIVLETGGWKHDAFGVWGMGSDSIHIRRVPGRAHTRTSITRKPTGNAPSWLLSFMCAFPHDDSRGVRVAVAHQRHLSGRFWALWWLSG